MQVSMGQNTQEQIIEEKYRAIVESLNERARRLWAASEAKALGRGGPSMVHRATGLAITTIRDGLAELSGKRTLEPKRIRRRGGGRKSLREEYPELVRDIEQLLESSTRGDPESPLRWTCKSTRKIADELRRKGYNIGCQRVSEILKQLRYSLQANRKTLEGAQHPDRNAQFEHIAKRVAEFQRRGQPVISVDTKKKELVGNYKNNGQEWSPKGQPEKVKVHDFEDPELGKAIPYGVYDQTFNTGWVNVGIDHDTGEFAVESIRRWWLQMGQACYPSATQLLITADSGGSNNRRSRLWKLCLQKLADELGLRIFVCHLPPGTSKWNKIEHRLFSHITMNWRGRPLTTLEVVVSLISCTTTQTGLKIAAKLDTGLYQTGLKISDKQFAEIHLIPDAFHGEWNYAIEPREPSQM
jgi:hypothetical protein